VIERYKTELFQTIGYEWQQSQMSCFFDSLGYFSLVFRRVAGKSSWKDFTLLIDEFQKEVGILVVDILDTVLLESAIFLSDFASVDWFVY
jgi:hypothetical protein